MSILVNRWCLLGHNLRMNEDTPARKSTSFYFSPSSKPKFKGRQRLTLPLTINNLTRTQSFKNIKERFGVCAFTSSLDLNKLVDIASDRKRWIKLSQDILEAAQGEEFNSLNAIVH